MSQDRYACIEDAAAECCREVGITWKRVAHDDFFHRVPVIEARSVGNRDGAIQITTDGQRVQAFNFKTGAKALRFLNGKGLDSVSSAELARIEEERRQRAEALAGQHDQKAKIAERYFCGAKPWPFEPTDYLKRKQLPSAYCAKLARFDRRVKCLDGEVRQLTVAKTLLVPVWNKAGKIRNVQTIFDEAPEQLGRDKTFLFGAEIAGCFCRIGSPSPTVFLTEGFADSAAVHTDTEQRVYCAFSAGNLPAVAQVMRELHPEAEIIVVGDNDAIGIEKANEAAALADGAVWFPPEPFKDYSDWYVSQRTVTHGQ
jgi:putative DNA primase/helicase